MTDPAIIQRAMRLIVRSVAGLNAVICGALSVVAVHTWWMPWVWSSVLGVAAGASLLLAVYPRSRGLWMTAGALSVTGLASRPVGLVIEWIHGQTADVATVLVLGASMALCILFAAAWLRVVGPLVDE